MTDNCSISPCRATDSSLAVPRPQEELVLVGFRVDGQHDGPQFYTVLAVGGGQRAAITADGRLVFFTRLELGAKALALNSTWRSSVRRRKNRNLL